MNTPLSEPRINKSGQANQVAPDLSVFSGAAAGGEVRAGVGEGLYVAIRFPGVAVPALNAVKAMKLHFA